MPRTWPWPDLWSDLPLPRPWDGDPPAAIARSRNPRAERALALHLGLARSRFMRDFGEWLNGRSGPLGEDERAWVADPYERRKTLIRLLKAEAAVAVAIEEDRRLARETFALLTRRAERMLGGHDGALVRAFREMVFAHGRVARLPLLATPTRRVIVFLAADGCPVELIGWTPEDPDAWEVRCNVFPVLMGWQFDPGGEHVRLCRNPASWWEAGGDDSAALCLLDATDLSSCNLVERAKTLTCDDGEHAAAVDKWLRRRWPKLPKLFVSDRSAA